MSTNIGKRAPKRATRTRDRAATLKGLLDSAELEFAARGFEGARLSHVAERVGVKQALIHHYFGDKEGLYRAVVTRAFDETGSASTELLAETALPTTAAELRSFTEALVAVMTEFYVKRGPLLAILRYDRARAEKAIPLGVALARRAFKPAFELAVDLIEQLKASKLIATTVEARHLILSVVGMVSVSMSEGQFIEAVWTKSAQSPAFVAARQKEIVETVLARCSS